MSLTARMIIPIALITSIALAFVAGSAYQGAKEVVFANLITVESTVVEGVSRELRTLLESSRNYMRVSAQREVVGRYARETLSHKPGTVDPGIQAAFHELLSRSARLYTHINFMEFIDKNGVARANSESRDVGARRTDRDYFQDAKQGKSSIQGPLFTRINRQYAFFLGEPVYVDGQFAGVLSGAMNMEYLSENNIENVTLRGKGYVYVIDSNGQILLHPDRNKVVNSSMVEQAVFEVVSDGGSGSFGHESDGVSYYSTYRSLPNGWIVIATVSRDLMLTDLVSMRNGIILAAFFAVWFVIFAMFVIVCRIVAALREGVHFAENVAAGNLDHTFDIHRKDEIGALAAALNTMVGRLKNSIDVAAQRTEEAERARTSATSTSLELQTVINSIDGGVARFVLDDELHVLWANTGFYNLSGGTEKTYAERTGNCGINEVHSEDRAQLLATLREHAEKGNFLHVEYRILREQGRISWIYLRAKRVGEWNGFPLFIGVFVDITQQKNTIQALQVEQERYRVISEITNEILFDQDLVTNTKILSANYEKIFGLPCRMANLAEQVRHTRTLFHPDDL